MLRRIDSQTIYLQETARQLKLKHRLEEDRREGEERRRQSRTILRLLSITYTALFLMALFLAIRGTAEQQRWALGALMTVLGSILGYLVGKKT
ncbi:hypothetical protein POL68_26790 [Stigmatella sp. ncwal1]|uniref:Uncharacterized protein n=1 Tax=Stigmatella ashevillensis TaxID=2995309 RepID=A0ABT5DEN6_9BACT|nr:hypothetical protein [Stigmatella ashevillena]MDC0712102.1 hypothetical protein [Stigmatella ashevillena]